ncbi:uncharacterized protein LOC143559815 [Bidens hawaiensis]|uniref:uncharacterized protein LOC143559815 n=1 Tax=Bidens hawaiensis TaxID=980011 RepID=UPI00404AC6BC
MISSEASFAGCEANLLVYGENIGWRECGARVSLESDQHNEWKLAVKHSGELRYTYKAVQDLQPGFTNRYTHVMMWKGEKDWGLEFPDRSQWSTFKEMHEECRNRNIRAVSLKRIPIPGVRAINDSVDIDMPCFNRGYRYMRHVGDDVEMALDASHVMYDMDSDDEQWVCKVDMISDEVFEKVMDMFEKLSYAQKRDHFTPEEIEELIASVSPVQDAKSVYDYWWEKRQRKGVPLIRQLQPPLWEIYQKRCREWEKQKLQSTRSPLGGSREKVSTAEDKPPMFAFCLKPRGLELVNKGSRHRPQKKISLSSHVSVDNSGGHRSSGKLTVSLLPHLHCYKYKC